MEVFYWKQEHKAECYNRLVSWWEKHKAFGGEPIPYESMPNRVFTALTKIKSTYKELYSVAVYATDSDIAWIGWITSNPEATIREKYKALEFLYKLISTEMNKQGFKVLVSKTNDSGLMRTLDNTGFIKVEPNTNFYIKDIK